MSNLGPKRKLYPVFGKMMTIREIASRTNMNEKTVWSRLRNGKPIEERLPPSRAMIRHAALLEAGTKAITFNGRTQSGSQWAAEIGISESTLRERLITWSWPVERALTEPVNPPGRKPKTGGTIQTSQESQGTGALRHESYFDSENSRGEHQ